MREIDRRAQQEFGIPELILMEHAGTAAAQETLRVLGSRKGGCGRVVVLSGGGANGGDGFVAARHLHNWGYPVGVVLTAPLSRVRGAARINLNILRRIGVNIRRAGSLPGWRRWAHGTRRPRAVVDALLGTGADGPIREPIRSAILWVNRQGCPVVSVDLPSGLSADRGRPDDVAVRADRTVTCGLPKTGFRRREARIWCGRVAVADISLPRGLR